MRAEVFKPIQTISLETMVPLPVSYWTMIDKSSYYCVKLLNNRPISQREIVTHNL